MSNKASYSKPVYYSRTENDDLHDWPSGPVSEEDLKKRSPDSVSIEGLTVRTLYFITPDDRCIEWNCIHGWLDPETSNVRR